MTVRRAKILSAIVLASSVSMVLAAAPADAQVADEIVLNIMRECAKIDDPTARLACYDNNIRAAGANPRNSVPGTMNVPQGGVGAPAAAASPQGFGSENVRTPRTAAAPGGQVNEIFARVASVTQLQPGRYRLTLEDGAIWEFAEDVPFSYSPPREGSEVEIDRASMGSFLMRYNNQQSVRVRRVQ